MPPVDPIQLQRRLDEALQALDQSVELRAFAVKAIKHLTTPGPSPEKTAEYFQLSGEARLLQQALTS